MTPSVSTGSWAATTSSIYPLPTQLRPTGTLVKYNNYWWTTTTFKPSSTSSAKLKSVKSKLSSATGSKSASQTPVASKFPPSGSPSQHLSTASSSCSGNDVCTIFVPVTTVTQRSTTLTSFSKSIVHPTSSFSNSLSTTATTSEEFSSTVPTAPIASRSDPVCLGKGLDAAAQGLLAAVIVPSAIGLVLWLLFAILRPRFRQVYGLREWFVQQDLRPKPLGSSFFAFLFPHVPLVPKVPSNVSDAGRSTAEDANLFPSDEQLNQRALYLCFLIVSGWALLALGGALPLYLVSTPCQADLPSPAIFSGGYSSLQDLSLLRLLRLFDQGNVTTTSLRRRADPENPLHARERIILLTVFTLVLGLAPALWKILKEFNALVAYRRRWLAVKCEGKDLGWLSAEKAPGFANWGERRLKDYIVKLGLSSTLDNGKQKPTTTNTARPRNGEKRTRRSEEIPLNQIEDIEVDVQTLFSICDTQQLAHLIDERDEILENLEIAETRYISSFRVTTPDPSILDFQPPPPPDPSRPYISRPLPLGPQIRTGRRRRAVNRAFAASSLAPTSFVAPSSYYKLRGVHGVSGGRFAGSSIDQLPSLQESINSRVIGSRFLEVNRNSEAFGRLPLGSHVMVEKDGQFGPAASRNSWLPPIPDPRLFGPNYAESLNEYGVDEYGVVREVTEPDEEEEWVDLMREQRRTNDFGTSANGSPHHTLAGPSVAPRPPPKDTPEVSVMRESFPLRNRREAPESVPPPHLRLQPTQPFVRPLDGLNFDDLGHVYGDITLWRSRLKIINAAIAEAQEESYKDIAEGQRIKGWLMVGRGLRFIPGIELIEGRAKEDIRWDVLQNERTWMDSSLLFVFILLVVVLLAAGLTAAAGLAVATAPDFSHFLTFLHPLLNTNPLASGIATVLAPAVAATIFIIIALAAVNWSTKVYGSTSISGNQLFIFKITFFVLTALGTIWLIAVGALLFAMEAFSSSRGETKTIASGAIYMSVLALAVILNVAIIFPALLMLQPFRLLHVLRAERQAVTPRQRFRAVYPRTYNPSFAIGACVLAIVFASTFALIFPLIAPAVVLLLFLALIAHRYMVGYVYARTHSQTGGLLQIWLLKRFGTLLSFQPILIGLIFLSRHIWIEGVVLVAAGVVVVIFVEGYTNWKVKLPGRKSLSPITQNSLQVFESGADSHLVEEGSSRSPTANGRAGTGTRRRGSIASVLDMMSVTLAVMPTSRPFQGPVPLHTETLDDLTATERAARTHPDAPPHLPPLPFTDHAEEMAGILYAPELIAPPPIIWLPNDSAGVARSEAVDLQKYHDLQVTLDVRAQEDVMPRRSSSHHRP